MKDTNSKVTLNKTLKKIFFKKPEIIDRIETPYTEHCGKWWVWNYPKGNIYCFEVGYVALFTELTYLLIPGGDRTTQIQAGSFKSTWEGREEKEEEPSRLAEGLQACCEAKSRGLIHLPWMRGQCGLGWASCQHGKKKILPFIRSRINNTQHVEMQSGLLQDIVAATQAERSNLGCVIRLSNWTHSPNQTVHAALQRNQKLKHHHEKWF